MTASNVTALRHEDASTSATVTRGHPHPSRVDDTRFFTSRDGAALPLPDEEDAFFFAIFGDRTGGPPEGVRELAQAVREVNLLEPDLVMTVGDLIQGYNVTEPWMTQMREFKGIMDDLLCPWFPVAGNHDVYWRGPGRPAGEHEAHYETHFGPLWYAFSHKDSWFIVLYSDEGDPVTGEKTFSKPSAQRMSDEQRAWLRETLDRASDARHVFVFLHHPRWLGGGYGDDWERVHEMLVTAGNVRAVFAGHIHRMRYDGPRDGIEYVTLATTGGGQGGAAPEAGYLHHFHLVTVRPSQIALAAVPLGEVMDVRAITGEVSDETRQVAQMRPSVAERIIVDADGAAEQEVRVTITNSVSRPIDVTLTPESRDSRWLVSPSHAHRVIEPGAAREFVFAVNRGPVGLDETFAEIDLLQAVDYLAEGARYHVPERAVPLPLRLDLAKPRRPRVEHVLRLDGRGDYLEVGADLIPVPDGPLTLECRFRARAFSSRTGLVTKMENSEYGIFVSDGVPAFFVFLDGSYAEVKAPEPVETGVLHHVAGVYDGSTLALYLDGRRVATLERSGRRRTNGLPLLVGADVDGAGNAMSHFDGEIDALRLSTIARYDDPRFRPARRHQPDEHTALLLNMDGVTAKWVYDESGNLAHPVRRGDAEVGPATGE
jgi:hypothetical protein